MKLFLDYIKLFFDFKNKIYSRAFHDSRSHVTDQNILHTNESIAYKSRCMIASNSSIKYLETIARAVPNEMYSVYFIYIYIYNTHQE